MTSIETWWAAGDRVGLDVGSATRQVAVQRMGAGAPMTLLHGFPSSSHDWAKLAPELVKTHALLLPDLLGFGASDKPRDHGYAIHEQADLVVALWAHEGIEATRLVAHDYSVSVVQELLARKAEGRLDVALHDVVLLNGGVYPDLHRPEPMQIALLDRVQGPQISAHLTEELLVGALAPTFAPGYDAAADSAAIARSMGHGDGLGNAHLLIRYIEDRREHETRWVAALEGTDVPLAFVWGMLDPVSGAHMAERIRERLPDAAFTALEDVGHWPPLEAPDRVAGAVLAAG